MGAIIPFIDFGGGEGKCPPCPPGSAAYATASAVSFGAILSYEILDFGLQLLVCVDGIIEGKATE